MNLEKLAGQVQTLEDVEAIKQLKARYCAATTEWDENAFVSCFTEDAVWDGGCFGHYEGQAAIRDFFRALPKILSFPRRRGNLPLTAPRLLPGRSGRSGNTLRPPRPRGVHPLR